MDSSARLSATLSEIGARSFGELSGERRWRFWEVFLSTKYIHLDRPNPVAIELAKERKREGYGIVIVTGRPARLRDVTLVQLTSFGVPFDLLVMREDNFFAKDHEYKRIVVEGLRLRIAEAHDDSPDVCEAYKRYARRVYLWSGGSYTKVYDADEQGIAQR